MSEARSKRLKETYTDERRELMKQNALRDGSDPEIIAKRKAAFVAMPVLECESCGRAMKQHALRRHAKRCGVVCAVEWCGQTQHMNGWCRHHFKLYQTAAHYGVTHDKLFEIFRRADGKCEICEKKLELHGGSAKNTGNKASIDHDHETGKVRGILCFNCNSGLGHFKDSTERIVRALEYLSR